MSVGETMRKHHLRQRSRGGSYATIGLIDTNGRAVVKPTQTAEERRLIDEWLANPENRARMLREKEERKNELA